MTVEISKLNFREVGGLPTASGMLLRHGVLYRSGGPASFSVVHHEEVFGFPPDACMLSVLLGVKAEFLSAAFRTIGKDFGSVNAYYATAGVTTGMRQNFKILG